MTKNIFGAATSNTAALYTCAVYTADLCAAAGVSADHVYLAGSKAPSAKPEAGRAVVAPDVRACAGSVIATGAGIAPVSVDHVGSFSPAARHRRPRALSVIEDRYREKSR